MTFPPGVDVFVFDRLTGVNRLVSRSAADSLRSGNANSYGPAINEIGSPGMIRVRANVMNVTPSRTGTSSRMRRPA